MSSPPSRLARILVPLVLVLALGGGLAAIKSKQIGMLMQLGAEMEQAGPAPETVSTAEVTSEPWEGRLQVVGSVTTVKGVTLSNDIAGVVQRLHFDSGQTVKSGQVLLALDTSVERAQLASLRTRLELAESTAKRAKVLADKGALTPAELERDESAAKTQSAEIQMLLAQISKKTVRAPFAGKLGIRHVNLGQYLQPGTTIAVLESAGGVHVDFSVPQQRLSELELGMKVHATVAGSEQSLEGTLSAIDPAVDASTRMVKLQANLSDPEQRLRPGMFVKVTVALKAGEPQVVVPLTALVRAPYGDSVFVVESKPEGAPVVRQQFVRKGEIRGDFVAIEQGLEPGLTVVRAGAFKLRNGSTIVVNNEIGLSPEKNPELENR